MLATVTPGRSGFSIGAASASAASMRASVWATLPAVTAPKLWPITPTVEPSKSCAIGRGIAGSSDITAWNRALDVADPQVERGGVERQAAAGELIHSVLPTWSTAITR